MTNKLEFRRDQKSTNQHQVAKWLGYAHAGPQYHALATVDQKEVRYSIVSLGPYWYLHMADDRYEVFNTKREAVAFAQEDLASKLG